MAAPIRSVIILANVAFMMISTVGAEMKCPLLKPGREDTTINRVIDQVADTFINRCPFIGQSENYGYCCYNEKLEARCCEVGEFLVNMSVFAVVILIILMVVSTIVSCACCLCCPCCFLYKRRHAGRVFQSEPAFSAITVNTRTPAYAPISKTHLPPGAYPVLPTTAEARTYRSQY